MDETAEQPDVLEIPTDGEYTLIVVDPDAGRQPGGARPGNSDRYYLHWLVVNISGGDVNSGNHVVPYQGPSPPSGTGKHEYRFLLYKQACGLTNGVAVKNRPQWSLQGFLKGKEKCLQLVDQKSMFVSS